MRTPGAVKHLQRTTPCDAGDAEGLRLDRLGPDALRALGIVAVLRADLTKKADAYSGMFSPARPA